MCIRDRNNKAKLTKEQIAEMKAKLAGFAGEQPVFLETDDNRANKSANVIALQAGTLTGLNSTSITGSNMNIIVMLSLIHI